MKNLRDIEHLDGVKVLLRADFNVPVENGVVVDDFRIRIALPTIEYLQKKGAKILMISHIQSSDEKNLSLAPVAKSLEKLGIAVSFVSDLKTARELLDNKIQNGGCILVENIRNYPGEIANDSKFAEELASLADIFVNEAFPVSHREHASIVSVPKFIPSYAGFQLEKEVQHLSSALNPSHPCVFILGGAKFDTKLPLIEKFIKIADTVFIGGALANDALKAKGISVGASRISSGSTDISHIVNQPNVMLPVDVVVQDRSVKSIDDVGASDIILDDGSKSLELLKEKIMATKFILWNGPLGLYEDGYKEGTLGLAKIIAEATEAGAKSIVGGGDTIAAIQSLGLLDKFTFVSTGGGAMLDFLALGTLPGIEALEESRK